MSEEVLTGSYVPKSKNSSKQLTNQELLSTLFDFQSHGPIAIDLTEEQDY